MAENPKQARWQFSLQSLIAFQAMVLAMIAAVVANWQFALVKIGVAYFAIRLVALAISTLVGLLCKGEFRKALLGAIVGIAIADLALLVAGSPILLIERWHNFLLLLIPNPLLLVALITSPVAVAHRHPLAVLASCLLVITLPLIVMAVLLWNLSQSPAQGTGLASAATVYGTFVVIVTGLAAIAGAYLASNIYARWEMARNLSNSLGKLNSPQLSR